MMKNYQHVLLSSLLFAYTPFTLALGLEINVIELETQQPVYEAVIIARPIYSGAAVAANRQPAHILVDQVDKEFVNKNTVIRVGDSINFPNKDNIRHHVYSFSNAKNFELALYKETPAEPILFDKPGVVKLGCNIHDWMVAYIYVADSPFNTMTGQDGNASISELPEGEYDVRIWHARMSQSEKSTSQRIIVKKGEAPVELSWQIAFKPDFRPRRAPMRMTIGY